MLPERSLQMRSRLAVAQGWATACSIQDISIQETRKPLSSMIMAFFCNSMN